MTTDETLGLFGEAREIIHRAKISADIWETLWIGYPMEDEDRVIIENEFMRSSIIINMRTTILELSKLFPDPSASSRNFHYSLRTIIKILRDNKLVDDKDLKPFEDQLDDLEQTLGDHSENSSTRVLQIWRDKVIAHTDRDRGNYKNMGISIQLVQELIQYATEICEKLCVLTTVVGMDFRYYFDVKGNLKEIIQILDRERKAQLIKEEAK
jgi:hypothetical protein